MAALTGNPTHFRLAAEAHRIRLAFQYDPHFAVSVSQVDPLPHQMDAVYAHLLTQPQIRFLIADDPGAGKTIMAGAEYFDPTPFVFLSHFQNSCPVAQRKTDLPLQTKGTGLDC